MIARFDAVAKSASVAGRRAASFTSFSASSRVTTSARS
jgi:hypothetical protein